MVHHNHIHAMLGDGCLHSTACCFAKTYGVVGIFANKSYMFSIVSHDVEHIGSKTLNTYVMNIHGNMFCNFADGISLTGCMCYYTTRVLWVACTICTCYTNYCAYFVVCMTSHDLVVMYALHEVMQLCMK
jgi:hypothetical protein